MLWVRAMSPRLWDETGRASWRETLALAVVLVVLVVAVMTARAMAAPNASTDGRRHTCGYVTASGVTEHLGAYAKRCPGIGQEETTKR